MTLTYLSLAVAVLALCANLWQGSINQQKLRLDLYNKRFSVFDRTLNFYQALTGKDVSSDNDIFSTVQRQFISAVRESQFLFDETSGIFKLLQELNNQSFKVIGCKRHAHALASSPEDLLRMHNEMLAALSLFEQSLAELEGKLAIYLNFHKASG